MKKSTILAIIVIALVLAGLFMAMSISPNEVAPPQTGSQNSSENQIADSGNNRYLEYTPEGYEIQRNQRHLLYFYANWCPTCRPVDAEIKRRVSEIPEDFLIIKVNYNDTETDIDEEEFAEDLNITYQHTFVLFDENGNEIKRWNGGDFDTILQNIL